MSPNQANNFEKLTCINIQETRQWIDNKKKNRKQVEKKTKPVLEGGFRPLPSKQWRR